MLGLMLKDLYNLKWQTLGLGVLIIAGVVLSCFSDFPDVAPMLGAIVAVVVCLLNPLTLMTLDEKDNWDRIALTMPVARRDMVLSKYALCLMLGLLANAVLLLCFLLTMPWSEAVALMLGTLRGAVIFISLLLPLMFKLGVNNARLAFLLICFLAAFLTSIGQGRLLVVVVNAMAHMNGVFLLILLLALSIFLSLKAYARKEF